MGSTMALARDEASTAQESDFYRRLTPLVVSYAARPDVTRVAVVGNQPLAPSADRADLIDGADIVFRVNGFRADRQGDPPAVGTRTDVVVFNRGVRPTPWFFHDYTSRLYLMIEPGRLLWENPKVPAFWPADLGFVTMPNREVILPLGREIDMDPRAEGVWATTGTVMLWIATRLFPDVTIDAAGFSFVDEPEQAAWDHAYGDSSPVGPEHRIAQESALVNRWISDGRITFHR